MGNGGGDMPDKCGGFYMKKDGAAKNYYGSLCTRMYEILHEKAPQDELDFYLSYAKKGERILEALCGSGRFFVPFYERGFDIHGVDLSAEMLEKLLEKAPDANVVCKDIVQYAPEQRFDYIFISSGSVSLFTDMDLCKAVLKRMKELLMPGGKFVFAVETIADRCAEDGEYREDVSVRTEEGLRLCLRTRNHYDEESRTQFSPGIYELYDGETLLQEEFMDFQTHLYSFGEMEAYLEEAGFKVEAVYSDYSKHVAEDDSCEMFLFECMHKKPPTPQRNFML